jgi:hypothetical protein
VNAWWRTTTARWRSELTMASGGSSRISIHHAPTVESARAAGLGVLDLGAVTTRGLHTRRAAYVQGEQHPLHFVCSPYREFNLLLLHMLCDLGAG